MKILLAKLIFVFTTSAILFCACPNNEDANQASNNANRGNTANNSNNNAPNDDVEELGKIVKLPFLPEEAVWRETNLNNQNSGNRVPAPNEKKLIGVLRFSPADAQGLITQAEKYNPSKTATIDVETWFPAELIAQSQLSGDETLKGTTYAANDFFQNSYNNGKLFRIEDTNYFVLEMVSN